MKEAPNIYYLPDLIRTLSTSQQFAEFENKKMWSPKRPVGFFSLHYRIKAALIVFFGRGDVVIWPNEGIKFD